MDAGFSCGFSSPRRRERYLALLTWAFTSFNSIDVMACTPSVWAIWSSGDSSRHSLWIGGRGGRAQVPLLRVLSCTQAA